MLITKEILNELIRKARTSPRLRANMDLRNTQDDTSQRMLNAIEPDSVIPIHRHPSSSETCIVIQGSVTESFHDNQGNVIQHYELSATPGSNVLQIPANTWHSLKSNVTGTIIFEVKDGRYVPLEHKDMMQEYTL